MRAAISVAVAALVGLAGQVGGQAVGLSAGPKAQRVGANVHISFAVTAATDVEVTIVNAGGKVVRRLAAGVLGGANPPPAPLKAGLAQELVWDGRDDAGQPAAGGPFKVRVRAGLKPELDGFLLDNPDASGPIAALAAGPNGSLYVFHHDGTALPSHWGSKKVKIYNRQGQHVRAIVPFPADIAPDRIKALAPFLDERNRLVPHIHHLRRLSVYPTGAEEFANHQSPVVDSKGRVYWLVRGPSIAAVDADGGIPYETFIGPRLMPDIKNLRMANPYTFGRDTPALALSGDEKFLYLAGLGVGVHGKEKEHQPLPCVLRIDLATRGPGEVFLGKLDTPGADKELLTAPRGLAAANGMIYVADSAANRIAVFREADRSFVGQIDVEDPQSVGVDPATGAVYVCAHTGKPNPNGKQTADLIKFDGYQNAQELYRLTLPKTGLNPNTGVHRIAVDASAKPVLIWLPDLPYSPCRLACIEDTGEKFENKGDPRNKAPWAEGPRDLSLDRIRGELYVKVSHQKWFRFEEATGKTVEPVDLNKVYKYNLNSSANGTQIVVHPDGSLISMNWSKGLIRLDRKGNPINWPGRDTDCIPFGGLMNFMERALAVPNAEELYVILPNTYRAPADQKEKPKTRMHSVDVLGLDGTAKRTVVWQCTHGAVLRVDHKGNIYLAEPVKPVGRCYPEFFDGKLENQKRALTPDEGKDVFWNSYMYGSIVKFPPSGGAIWYDKDRKLSPSVVGEPPADLLAKPVEKVQAHLIYTPNAPAEIQGAEWYRFGFAPFAMHSGSDTCMCEGAGFDIDLYGRVFYPNLGQFRVEVVDAANNFIGTFGQYGNEDFGRDKPPATEGTLLKLSGTKLLAGPADVPLAWPLTVAVSDTHAYVADTVNRRVAKVRLAFAVEQSCPLN